MSSPKKVAPSKTPLPRQVFRIRVELKDSYPPIWRRLDVPADATLGWLHAVLQVAVGWSDEHVHQFVHGTRTFSDPEFGLEDSEGCLAEDERKVRIGELLVKRGQSLLYEYDLGDSWIHSIKLEKISDAEPGAPMAVCVEGEGACPPEDCGGVVGYEILVSILKDRKHPEYRDRKEWLEGPFDPDKFSVAKTNAMLGKSKFPKVTVGR